MRRKIFVIAATALALAACGGSGTEPTKSTPASVENTQSDSEDSEETSEVSDDVEFEEGEIFNQNGVKVSVTGYSTDGFYGPGVKVLIENDSDTDITVQPRDSVVNGYMVDFQMSCDVAAGKKANDTLSLMRTDLEDSGIDTIADLEFKLHIFDSDTFEGIVDSETISLHNSAAGSYVQEYDDSGKVLYDAGGIKIVSKDLVVDDDDIFGPRYYVYIQNDSESNITVQLRDTSVNGFMVDPTFSPEILPGKKIVDDVTFMSSELEENDIEHIDTIETSFHIFETNSFGNIADSEPVTINFD